MAKKGVGRPQEDPVILRQARHLVMCGIPDEGVAFIFGINMGELARWAWESHLFFDAITPSEQEISEWNAEIRGRREVRNDWKRRHLAQSKTARIRNSTSARLWAALKGRTDGKLFSRLGYTPQELVEHLEKQFAEGMSWGNYGKWHVDHKKPCSLFDLKEQDQFKECWSLDNLQPLWASENIQKGARYASA